MKEIETETTTGIKIETKEVTETVEIGITIETITEAKEEEKEGMKLPETEETNTIAEVGKQVITLIGTELKDSAQSFFRTLGGSFTEGVKKLAPSINESLENLKETIPEIKGTVDAVSSMPAIAKLLQTKENKEETQNEL
jgi:archaellum component FlaC